MTGKNDFIEFMLASDVLKFGSFKTKSGRLSPYFVNTGNYNSGAKIKTLGDYYADCLKQNIKEDVDALFGPAYKGIPLAAATASSLYTGYGIDVKYLYNRKEAKDHGEGGNIVGYLPTEGDRVVIIEDVITAGTALRETLPILLAISGVKVEHMIISVNRMEKGLGEKTAVDEISKELGITVHSIINAVDIYNYLKEKGKRLECEQMAQYMEKYCVL